MIGKSTYITDEMKSATIAKYFPANLTDPIELWPRSKVEEYQFQLWLGLRAIVVTTGSPLKIDLEVVDRTLELWRVNLAETAQSEGSAEHKVNSEMVQWLGFCIHRHQGLLVPPA